MESPGLAVSRGLRCLGRSRTLIVTGWITYTGLSYVGTGSPLEISTLAWNRVLRNAISLEPRQISNDADLEVLREVVRT